MPSSLLFVLVHVHVKPDVIEAFKAATLASALGSRRERGVLRFDMLQERADPTRFTLVEIYRDEAAAAAHKDTAHYLTWRDSVADMMAEPRRGVKYVNVSPDDSGW